MNLKKKNYNFLVFYYIFNSYFILIIPKLYWWSVFFCFIIYLIIIFLFCLFNIHIYFMLFFLKNLNNFLIFLILIYQTCKIPSIINITTTNIDHFFTIISSYLSNNFLLKKITFIIYIFSILVLFL